MSDFTSQEEKLCYDAVRYYQMNHIGPFKHAAYETCNSILKKLEHTQPYYNEQAVGTADWMDCYVH